ncbi:MAG: UDP-N-acetylmuramoyl-L-alanine--D-glutamate ligase, partial [Arenicellales bacterium]
DKKELKRLFPKARLVMGGLDQHTLETADMVVVSPGVSVTEFDLENRVGSNTQLLGDIELFARHAKAPIIAITGSNAKSTVATMTDILINAGGKRSLLGGNIGVPALDLLTQAVPDAYVLELSSFQLDTTQSLAADVAVVLNLSEDHLDRYPSYQAYIDSKKTIYRNARSEVINRDEPNAPQIILQASLSFGLGAPSSEQEFGIIREGDKTWLAQGTQKILDTDKLSLKGQQNWVNVLASFALVKQFSLQINDDMLDAICAFTGLADRCEQVADHQGVVWVNDSKGTNVGATLAAILAYPQPKIMIMGGQGKGADFSDLKTAMASNVKAVILLGEDADKIEAAIKGEVAITHVESIEAAVIHALDIAQSGDMVLLSPACASFDMFANYQARGVAFRQCVNEIVLDEAAA